MHRYVKEQNPELDASNEQIRLLKSIVARQQMEIEFKDELLKKINPCRDIGPGSERIQKKSSSDVEYINIAAVGIPTQEHILYRRSDNKSGSRSSETTLKNSGEVADNRVFVTQIEESLSGEFCCYGYKNACECLRDAGLIIIEKKVYRLMKEHNLL